MRIFPLILVLVLFFQRLEGQVFCPTSSTSCGIVDHPFLPTGQNHKWADMTGNGQLDLVQWEGNFQSNAIVIYENRPSSTNRFSSDFTTRLSEGGGTIATLPHFAIADLNNNLLPDIVVVRTIGGVVGTFISLQINFNEGNGVFNSISLGNFEIPSLNGTSDLTDPVVGDIDNDGDQDIIFCSTQCFLLRNEGAAGFILDLDFCIDFGSGIFFPSFLVDLDKDGFLDLIGTRNSNNTVEDDVVKIFYAIGSNCTTCYSPLSLDNSIKTNDIGDFDNDGDIDLLMSDQSGSLRILLNDHPVLGYSTLDEAILDECSDEVFDAQWADIDNDGDLDIGLCDIDEDCVIYRNDQGEHTKIFDFSASFPSNPNKKMSIVFGDFNSDNEIDFCGVVLNNDFESTSTYYAEFSNCGNNLRPQQPDDLTVVTFPGHGDVFFEWADAEDDQLDIGLTYNLSLTNGQNVVSPLSDLDGIRQVVGIGAQGQNTSHDLSGLSTGDYEWKVQAIDHSYVGGTWSETQSFTINNCFEFDTIVINDDINAFNLHVGDLVEESGPFPDLIVGNRLLPNQGALAFGPASFLELSAEVVCRDLNSDNLLDLIYYSASSISIELNLGNGQFSQIFTMRTTAGKPVVGDIDNDGDRDVLIGSSTDEIRIIRNLGNGSFAVPTLLYEGSSNGSRKPIELLDVDQDGDLDILSTFVAAVQTGSGSFYSVQWIDNDDGVFENVTTIDGSGLQGPIAVGDIDADGDKDIVLGRSNVLFDEFGAEPGILIYVNSNGIFSTEMAIIDPCDYFFSDIQLGDMDNDGKLDIVGIINVDNQPGRTIQNSLVILRNDYDVFTALYSFTEVFQKRVIGTFVLADIDLDLDIDIVYATCSNSCIHALVNQMCIPNTAPTAPQNVTCTEEEDGILLTWERASDVEQNDSSLTYNIQVYADTFSQSYVVSPESYEDSGTRKIVRFGDQCHNLSWRITGLPEGNYCFRVQAVDHSYVGGAWSEEACCRNELCVEASVLECGQDTIGDNGLDGRSRISAYMDCDSNATGFIQPELIYKITGFESPMDTTVSNDIFIGLQELGEMQAGLDVFIIENCNADNDEEVFPVCVASIERIAGDPEVKLMIPDANPNSEYFVIVDSKNTTGDFRISVSCPDGCFNDAPLDCQERRFANNRTNGSSKISSYFNINTNSYIDTSSGPGYAGEDYKVSFNAPRSGIYTLTLDSLTDNLDLFVLDQCNPFMCIADSRGSGNLTEAIEIALDSNQTIYIIVDAAPGVSSSFVLSVDCCNASESTIRLLDEESDSKVICKAENTSDTVFFTHSPLTETPYAYLLTNDLDVFLQEVPNSLDAALLNKGTYRVYGLSFENEFQIDSGQSVFDVSADICAILSNNFIDLIIDSTYAITIDTVLCLGEQLLVCDSLLSDAGTFIIPCQTANGCDSAITINIRIDTINAIIDGNAFYCAEDSTTLTVLPVSDAYLWSNGSTLQSISVVEEDDYVVTVTSENGCTDTASLRVIEIQELVPNLGNDTSLCMGNSVLLDLPDFATYRWSTGDTTRSLSITADGLYGVTVTNQTGCTGSEEIEVQFAPVPIANPGDERTICPDMEIDIDAIGGTSCLWFDQNGNLLSEACRLENVSPDSTVSYTLITSLSTDVNTEIGVLTCFDTATLKINVFNNDGGIRLIEDTAVCSGETFNIVQSIDCADCDCSWSTTLGFDDLTSCTPIVTFTETTTYAVTARNMDGCTSSDTVTVDVVQSPTAIVNINDTTICAGSALNLEGAGAIECLWLDDSGMLVNSDCNFPVTEFDSVIYQFVALNSGLLACSDTSTVTINVVDLPIVNLLSDTTICAGTRIPLFQDTDCPDCIYSWLPIEGLDIPSIRDPMANPSIPTTYELTTTTIDRVCTVSNSIAIAVNPKPKISAINDHSTVRQGHAVILDLVANDDIDSATASIQIDLNSLEPANVAQRNILIEEVGRKSIQVSANPDPPINSRRYLGRFEFNYLLSDSTCGSIDTGIVEIVVAISDIVTLCNPDIDGACSILPIEDLENYPGNDIVIFDREGNVVHVAGPYLNDWTGHHIQTGERVPTGSYYFVLNMGDHITNERENLSEPIKGVITIVRR